ncbi:MAG TPA: phosphatidate cytidylyltransferase, partial [Polyangia bacterium]
MSNLAARLLTAAVLIPLLVVAILWQNPLAVWGIVYLATFLGLREYYNMTLAKEPVSERGFGVLLGMAMAAIVYWFDRSPHVILAGVVGVTIGAFLFLLLRYRDMDTV